MLKIPFIEIFLISLGLSADAFSVAMAAGAHGFTSRRIFRLAFHFGLFQFMMPIIGWFGGDIISKYAGNYGPWGVLILLAVIGGKMIIDGIKNKPEKAIDLSRGWSLVSLSIGTSIDALGVGFGFGLLETPILLPATIIGVTCAAITTIGLYLGVKLFDRLGHRVMILGGIILIAIGVKMVI